MLNFLVTVFGKAAIEAAVQEIATGIATSQQRKTFRRAIRDIVEDEVEDFGRAMAVPPEVVKDYIKDKRGYFRDEIRARFDSALQGLQIRRRR